MRRKLLQHGAMAYAVALLAGLVLAAPATLEAQRVGSPALAEVSVSGGGVDFFPNVGHGGAKLTVSGAGKTFTRTFEAGERPSIGSFDPEGDRLADGTYSWELSLEPDAAARMALMRAASANGGEAPNPWRPLAGTFTVRGGSIASPDVGEAGADQEARSGGFAASSPGSFRTASRGRGPDSDASGASEADVRASLASAGAVAPSAYGAGLQAANPGGGADSDGVAMATGQSLEAGFTAAAPQAFVVNKAASTHRRAEPGGKNGRPEEE